MSCPHCRATEHKFDPRVAEADLRHYHRRGPNPTTRLMLAALENTGVGGRTVLDIGAGVGVLTHELLARGAARATVVDASAAYLTAAEQEAARRGTRDRIEFHHGDAAVVAAGLPPADLVTLDRVVCCYPDAEALLGAAAARCTGTLSLSFPRDRWYVRLVFALENALRALRGDPFRTFVHPEGAIRAALARAGLRSVGEASLLAWRVETWAR